MTAQFTLLENIFPTIFFPDKSHHIFYQHSFYPRRFTKLDEELMLMVVENCRHIVCNALDWKSQLIIQRQNEVGYV